MSQENVKVLIVDDEDQLRDIYVQELKNHVHFVLCAKNGIDALEQLKSNLDIEILITDLKMPKMNGLQLLEETNKLYPQLLKIIITSNRDFDSMCRALEFGVHDFLDKPIRMDMFAHTIKKATWLVIRERKRNKILEYLLKDLSNQPIEEFYKMDQAKQIKILDAVQEIVYTKMSKNKAA